MPELDEEIVVPLGQVETTKQITARKQQEADDGIPDGMELVGWELNGWVAGYPLIDDKARPVYAYIPILIAENE